MTEDSKNLRCETLYIGDYEYVNISSFAASVGYKAMDGRRWRLKQKWSFIFIQIHSVESSKLTQNVIIFQLYLYIQHSKLESFCIFVISNNKSFISQNLKVVGPLGGKFDFSVPRDLKFKAILITEPQKSSQSFEMLSELEKSDTWSSNSNDLKI